MEIDSHQREKSNSTQIGTPMTLQLFRGRHLQKPRLASAGTSAFGAGTSAFGIRPRSSLRLALRRDSPDPSH